MKAKSRNMYDISVSVFLKFRYLEGGRSLAHLLGRTSATMNPTLGESPHHLHTIHFKI
jgi:hypothetical protein